MKNIPVVFRLPTKSSLPAISAVAFLSIFWPASVRAQTWLASPGSGDWNTAGNWNPSTVPNSQTAVVIFGTSTKSSVALSGGVAIGSLTFNGATAYTLDLNGQLITVSGLGINNSSGLAQQIIMGGQTNGVLDFKNNATAGGSNISYSVQGNGTVQFQNTSTMGAATFSTSTNATIQMLDTSTGSGATVIDDGNLFLQKSNGVASIGALSGSGIVAFSNIGGGATAQNLTVGALNTSTTFSGEINNGSGATGALTKSGTGTFTLTGTNGYTGGTTISAGTLKIGQGGSIGGNVLDNAILNVNQTGTLALTGNITGSGKVIKDGTGTLTLSGASSYAGGTVLNAGTLVAGSNTALGNGLLTINGGTVGASVNPVFLNNSVLVNSDFSTTRAGAAVVLAFNGPVDLGGGNRTITNLNGGNTSFGKAITHGTGLTLASAPATSSVFQFSSVGVVDNTYTGTTTLNGATTLLLTRSAGSNAVPGDLVLNDKSEVDVQVSEQIIDSSKVTLNGTGKFSLLNASETVASINSTSATSNVNLQAGTLTLNSATDALFAGTVTGTGALVKNGTNTLTLTGNNTFQGGTTFAGGIFNAGSANALGSAGTLGFTGGTLQFSAANHTDYSGRFSTAAGQIYKIDTNGQNVTFATALTSSTGTLTKLGAGTLTLAAANTYTGATTVSAGTLTIAPGGGITSDVTNNATFATVGNVTGSVTNTGIVYAEGGAINGAVANNAGTFNVFVGTVTGNSTFDNALGATLAVGNGGSYTLQGLLTNGGAVTVDAGSTLVATAGGITNKAGGTIINNGTVQDDLNNAGTVTNNGTYVAHVASNSGTITNNNIWTGNVLSNAGSIVNAASATWTGDVSNAGTFNNAGTVTGTLTNTAGTTTNNGSISGAVVVSGGTFNGTGSTGNLSIGSGAVFAPGNGTPGTSATVNGSLAFASGAFYQIAINPTASSFVNATGTATLGGASVQAFFGSGGYVSKQYAIVNASGGVIGTFNSLANTNLPSGFTSTLSYDAKHAYLNLALNFTPPPTGPTSPSGPSGPSTPSGPSSPSGPSTPSGPSGSTPSGPSGSSGSSGSSAPPVNALTVNQQNVANTLVNFFNSSGSIPIVFGSLTPAGLTQISGETATGSQQTTFNAMNLFMGVMTDPFMAGRGDNISAAGGAAGYADESSAAAGHRKPGDALAAIYGKTPPPAANFEQRWSTWIAGYGGSQATDGNTAQGSNNTTSSVYGTAVGADYRFSPDTVAGFAFAGGGTNFSVNGAGSGHSDLFQAGAFIRHTQGAAYITGALAYGWQDIITDRTVTVAGVDHLRARFNANAISGRVEGGYRFVASWIGGVGITPYAAGQFTTFDLPSYAEGVVSGSNMFALAYNAKSVTDSRSEFGIRTDKSFAMETGIFTLRGRAAWAHDYNPDRSIAATFQALPGASFVANGAMQARDSALTTASAEWKWTNGWSAAATFEGEFSDVTRSYAGKGVVRYAW